MSLENITFNFDNSYARELDGFYTPWKGDKAPAPAIVKLNADLATELGLDAAALNSPEGAAIFSGSAEPQGASSLAQAYAGHQFGGFSPQLGDGRAILIGEVIDQNGARKDIHLKGSGRTPFSRGGDGKAVLGPILREYLMGEAMHALGIPTTRALAAVTTGEQIMREGMQPGAVLARVASSHLRVGTFQFFAARRETEKLRQLADYTIARHFPALVGRDTRYLELLRAVTQQQAALIARWMQVGFIHGVMNTDNMTISGETIDYGPCAFLDTYSASTVFSSIDQQGRYAFGNQPSIAQWNLARLAETLLPLLADDDETSIRLATNEVNAFVGLYEKHWLDGMRTKLGLETAETDDLELATDLLTAMEGQNVDFTIFFRRLGDMAAEQPDAVSTLFASPDVALAWLARWHTRSEREITQPADRKAAMDAVNPIYIPRNHLVEEALQAAVEHSDMAPFDALLSLLATPFTEQSGQKSYAQGRPGDFGTYKTFCGT